MSSGDSSVVFEEVAAALRYYANPRSYGSGEHSVFIDDCAIARRALDGLLDGPLHDLAGPVGEGELLAFDAAMAEEGPNVPFDPYGPTDEHPFGLSKAEVHPDGFYVPRNPLTMGESSMRPATAKETADLILDEFRRLLDEAERASLPMTDDGPPINYQLDVACKRARVALAETEGLRNPESAIPSREAETHCHCGALLDMRDAMDAPEAPGPVVLCQSCGNYVAVVGGGFSS